MPIIRERAQSGNIVGAYEDAKAHVQGQMAAVAALDRHVKSQEALRQALGQEAQRIGAESPGIPDFDKQLLEAMDPKALDEVIDIYKGHREKEFLDQDGRDFVSALEDWIEFTGGPAAQAVGFTPRQASVEITKKMWEGLKNGDIQINTREDLERLEAQFQTMFEDEGARMAAAEDRQLFVARAQQQLQTEGPDAHPDDVRKARAYLGMIRAGMDVPAGEAAKQFAAILHGLTGSGGRGSSTKAAPEQISTQQALINEAIAEGHSFEEINKMAEEMGGTVDHSTQTFVPDAAEAGDKEPPPGEDEGVTTDEDSPWRVWIKTSNGAQAKWDAFVGQVQKEASEKDYSNDPEGLATRIQELRWFNGIPPLDMEAADFIMRVAQEQADKSSPANPAPPKPKGKVPSIKEAGEALKGEFRGGARGVTKPKPKAKPKKKKEVTDADVEKARKAADEAWGRADKAEKELERRLKDPEAARLYRIRNPRRGIGKSNRTKPGGKLPTKKEKETEEFVKQLHEARAAGGGANADVPIDFIELLLEVTPANAGAPGIPDKPGMYRYDRKSKRWVEAK